MPEPLNPKLRHHRPAARPATAAEWVARLRGGDDRRALGQAITLLESNRPADRALADALIDELSGAAPPAQRPASSFRLGVSGTPGVGKSTFIERFGAEVLGRGHRLAVLAVDPSSSLSGGSILGDKTRMEELSRNPAAFIRPSPTGGHLGGVGAASRAAVLLCEAAGYDYVIVETVGVGQAEWRVHSMTDAFLLLAQPAAGDELQGIKRGILELADVIAVNKADRLAAAAKQTALELRRGLHLAPARPDGWTVPVTRISGLTGEGLPDLYDRLATYRSRRVSSGDFAARRAAQQLSWLRERCEHELQRQLTEHLDALGRTTGGLRRILDEHSTVTTAANAILADFHQQQSTKTTSE